MRASTSQTERQDLFSRPPIYASTTSTGQPPALPRGQATTTHSSGHATPASAPGFDRRNRFDRSSVPNYKASATHTQALTRGRAEAVYMPPPSRNWSVSPPRCAAEMPRVNPDYEDHRDVFPLGSPIITRVQSRLDQSSGHDVGKKHTPFQATSTDETTRTTSSPQTPRITHTRPDELQLPDSPTSEMSTSHGHHIVSLLRGANAVRAVVAFERPVLHRQNAVRRSSLSVQSPHLQYVRETNTKEARLGLVRTGQSKST
ncbi:hypothetical protein PMIN01_11857 [Paraphaeosphaeria minitans]|uniref:Uncharacterized protein n=1 Tax=Paraphaeosphaeria minitans TaxID=565426 RepID=A0A9P6KKY9_9PLEO|nr:hypothetical protein PMIN01_11857 [Paraphaeosphaeria minitans]